MTPDGFLYFEEKNGKDFMSSDSQERGKEIHTLVIVFVAALWGQRPARGF